MLIDGENTGGTGADHLDLGTAPQSHFFEAMDELGRPVQVVDRAAFSSLKEFQWKELRHEVSPPGVCAGD